MPSSSGSLRKPHCLRRQVKRPPHQLRGMHAVQIATDLQISHTKSNFMLPMTNEHALVPSSTAYRVPTTSSACNCASEARAGIPGRILGIGSIHSLCIRLSTVRVVKTLGRVLLTWRPSPQEETVS
jgi:hypothetical protein